MDNSYSIPTVVIQNNIYKCRLCARSFLSTQECTLHEQQHCKPILIKNIYCPKDFEKPLKILENIKIENGEHFENNNQESQEWKESTNNILYKYEDKSWTEKAKRKTSSSITQRLKQSKEHDKKIKNTKIKLEKKSKNDVHVNKGPDGYKCPHCPKIFKRHIQIVEHYKEHVTEMPYSCEVCSQRFLRIRDYTRHKTCIHGKIRKPNIFNCPHCPAVFKYKTSLQPHIDIHTGEKPHKCKECGRAFRQRCALDVHMKAHRNSHEHKCKFCQKGFNNLCNLHVHEKIHINNREYKCSFCPKDFNDRSACKRHERIHTRTMMYTCELCRKQFTDLSGYIAHKLRHDPNNRTHKCDQCPKVFFDKSNLMLHRKAKHKEEYACTFCTAKFTMEKDLNTHWVQVHSNMEFQCDICNFITPRKGDIVKHIRRHYRKTSNNNGKIVTVQKPVKYYY